MPLKESSGEQEGWCGGCRGVMNQPFCPWPTGGRHHRRGRLLHGLLGHGQPGELLLRRGNEIRMWAPPPILSFPLPSAR